MHSALQDLAIIRRFLTFTGVGALGTTGHYAVLIGFVELINVDPVVGSFLGATTGAFINYFLNRSLTFRSNVAHRLGLPRFMVVAGIGLALNTLFMYLFTIYTSLHYVICQIIATIAVLLWNYAGSALWVFCDSSQRNFVNRDSKL
jgi:putative flippase GtrA